MEVEIGMMQPQAKECQQPPETRKCKGWIFPQSFQKECDLASIWISDF